MDSIFSTEGFLNKALTSFNDVIWTYFLITLLILCALWFTIRSKGVQFRLFREMFRALGESGSSGNEGKKSISSFQAFAVSLASRIGTGNIAGVATAIAVGGPGAVFWMWVMAVLGAATAFVEATLAQLYKRKGKDSFIGGPAYYMKYGLHSPGMGKLFAILIIMAFGIANNAIQTNTICGALNNSFSLNPVVTGAVIAVSILVTAIGGVQRVARVSSVLVPVMAAGYLILSIVVIVMNLDLVPAVFREISESAFGIRQVAGGGMGAALMNGIKRGLFSNEAGEGSAPNAAATAHASHPVKQGLIQALGVFFDTLVICSCTAFMILISGQHHNGLNGIVLTQAALESEVGIFGNYFIALAILLFAFSTIVGNYYYGEVNVMYLTKKGWALNVYRLFSCVLVIFFGAVASLELAWSVVDFFMALMTLTNLIAITALGRHAFKLLEDYVSQKKAGICNPTFHASSMPEIINDLECWKD
ncbi:MAG: alanine:cation symporter family protein [Bacteroidales bacterium]|nr:alanine:cation symporter family protein [Bacteroidales bacterium]